MTHANCGNDYDLSNLSSLLDCKKLLQIVGIWYFPTFLLRNGLFALMYTDDILELAFGVMFLTPKGGDTVLAGHHSIMLGVTCLKMGNGSFMCSLNLVFCW